MEVVDVDGFGVVVDVVAGVDVVVVAATAGLGVTTRLNRKRGTVGAAVDEAVGVAVGAGVGGATDEAVGPVDVGAGAGKDVVAADGTSDAAKTASLP